MFENNCVYLIGIISTVPIVKKDVNGEPEKAVANIVVIKRTVDENGNVQNENTQLQLRSQSKEIAKTISTLSQYNIVSLSGCVGTRNVSRIAICEDCLEQPIEDEIPEEYRCISLTTFVYPKTLAVIENKYSEEAKQISSEDKERPEKIGLIEAKTLEYLSAYAPASNRVQVIGNLCTEPKLWENKTAISYQIGINGDKENEQIKCYPYIRAYKREAKTNMPELHIKDKIYIDGSLKRRIYTKENICPCCGKKTKQKGSVVEITPYFVEPLEKGKAIEKGDEEYEI